MKKFLLTSILFLVSPLFLMAQDFSVTAPYTSPTRSTCGAVNNCALRGSEDHEYEVVVAVAGTYTFTLCGASYDTYLYIGTTLCSSNIGLNDDSWCGLDSEITVALTPGTYYVTVEGYSVLGCGTYVLDISCTACCVGIPVADFWSPTPICAGQAVNFSDLSTCTPTSWSWSFPGGTPATSTAQNPLVTYAVPGNYSVTLTATNAAGSDVEFKSNCVTAVGVTADFWSPTPICTGQAVNFVDLSTCAPTSWSWSFPGGTPATSTAQNPVVTYALPGNYDVTLTATNAGGSDVEFKSNCITAVGVSADFFAPTTVCSGQAIGFTDISTCFPTSWSWSFPGGTPATSTAQNPVVTYAVPGNYSVTLTAANATGSDVEFKSNYITAVGVSADFSAPTTVCSGQVMSFTDISTCNPTSWNWSFPGGTPATSTAQNPLVTYPATGVYSVTLTATNAGGSDVEVKNSYISVIDCSGSCSGNYYYVRSNTGSPWGSTSNEAAMNAVFGAGIWVQEYFQTANPAVLFSASTCTIFMDGSDYGATELETFTNANMTAMENWVAAGGRLFLNAAPNEDNGMNFGFGGTTMLYPSVVVATGTTVAPGHAIFNGPFLPVGTAWTGNWFAHGRISNAGTSLIEEAGNIVCSEKIYGAGVAVFGSMTSTNWHTPALEGQNLRQNILCYISPPIICGTPLPVEMSSFSGHSEEAINVLEWITESEHNSDFFAVERSADAKQFSEFAQVDAAGTSVQKLYYSVRDDSPFSGVTYYRLKQVDEDGQFEYSETIALDNRHHADITVFPSPADNIVTVTLVEDPEMTIPVVVRNAVGKTVHVTEFDQRVEIVDVSALPSGIYFITMIIDGEPTVQKFCVK